jgi:hypothetical protein
MVHLTENELFREACDVMRPDAAPEAVELHRILTEQLSMLLKCSRAADLFVIVCV